MLCKKPYIVGGRAFGCGQCMPCRLNRRRIWTHRIMLEARQYSDNAFITLTYDAENLPLDGSVQPFAFQKWMKRVRRNFPQKIRFFGVGEYGDTTLRPHYHAALFNYPSCVYGMSRYGLGYKSCCLPCDYILKTWDKGFVFLGSLEERSAAYLAGYVTKKMTHKDDPRLEGRHPEFARMSLRPGIGGDAMWEVADVVLEYDLVSCDVPGTLRHGSKELPLGRYLMSRVRSMVGMGEGAPQEVLDKMDAELLALRIAAREDEENPSLRSKIVDANAGKLASLEARERLFRRRRVL